MEAISVIIAVVTVGAAVGFGLAAMIRGVRKELGARIAGLDERLDGLDERMRTLETTQARLYGLLEGLGFAQTAPNSHTAG